ncbi:MAG: tol-pal system protein YbgF [Verrucomicrobiaceae bacterium]|nr:tol-pal system protein YbgF [Verrucomicrobiaceae bacterium]
MAMHLRFAKSLVAALCFGAALANAQAPIIDASQPLNGGTRTKSAAATPTGGNAAGDMYMQFQALQQDVMELRGLVEEQGHQIETLKQQSLDRYNDLDKRVGQSQAANAAVVPGAATSSEAPINAAPSDPIAAPASSVTAPIATTPSSMETAKPEEYEAYQVAYAKLKGQDFPGAIKLFNTFNTTYPNSSLTPNAYYWLGKAYLQPPQDLTKAQQAFGKVVGDHPQHNKAPDALYELGKVYFLKGDKVKAKTLLQQVIDNYGASGSSAPQFAKQFLDQNYGSAKR